MWWRGEQDKSERFRELIETYMYINVASGPSPRSLHWIIATPDSPQTDNNAESRIQADWNRVSPTSVYHAKRQAVLAERTRELEAR